MPATPPPPPPPPAIVQPAAPANAIGCNLDGNVDWSTAHVWTDAAHAFRTWGVVGKAQDANPALVLTADGYPLADADSLSYLNNYPNGVYKLTWAGTGDVQVAGMGRRGEVTKVGNTSTADVTLKHDNPDGLTGGMIYLLIRGTRAADPVRDVHLYAPGYGPRETRFGENFTDEFVRRVRPFASIRFMDWAATNNSTANRWADRVTPASMIQTQRGVAWEYIIDLANRCGRDAWINVPDTASDDYVQNLARLVHDKLDPKLKVRVEYSNEVWNAIFQQFHHTLAAAKANGELTANDDFGRSAQQYAVRAAHVMEIFQTVYGADAGRVIGVYGGQNSNNYWADTGLAYLKSHGKDPAKLFAELAIAPYVGNDLGPAPAAGWTVDALFADCEQFTGTKLAEWVRQAKKGADQYGLRLVTYEGGQHLTGNGNVKPELATAANADPRMFSLYHHMHQVWRDNSGGGLYQAFSHIGGGWGLLDDIRLPGSPKWDAVMDLLLPAGDVTLDGRVTFDDLKVLKAHFGQSGQWREQGDLDGDNKVDAKDLEILSSHLPPLTPEQQKELDALRGK